MTPATTITALFALGAYFAYRGWPGLAVAAFGAVVAGVLRSIM